MKVFLILLLAVSTAFSYRLHSNFSGNSFFDGWNFFTAGDPTHGTVDYVNEQTARSAGYIGMRGNSVYIGCDTKNKVTTGRGRQSVRLTSKDTYNSGLFIMDLSHMPTGCATWPAWWTVGPNWPNMGEIDIIEGVNKVTTDQSTLHTNAGCVMNNENSTSFTGHWASSKNCQGNTGCGIIGGSNSYGAPFNSAGGGAYVMEWNGQFIRMFFFPRGRFPSDLTSANPDTSKWGLPYANFFTDGECPASHFKSHQMVINLTFCGDWAGQVFNAQCPGLGNNCANYVKNTPNAFTEAYWAINYVAVYQ
jgi:hypothetical protein